MQSTGTDHSADRHRGRTFSASGPGNPDLEAIRRVHEAWIAAELRGDYEAVLALCTEDVRWLVPDSPLLEGKDAGRRLLQDESVRIGGIKTTDLRVEGTDTLAFKICRYATRFRTKSRPEERIVHGTHLWILRSVQGQWKIALVTWQSEGDGS